MEVLASIVLAGTLLTAILLAYGAHTRQIQQARRKQIAVAAANSLLRDWLDRDARLPSVAQGEWTWPSAQQEQDATSDTASLRMTWRLTQQTRDLPQQLELEVWRLEIFDPQSGTPYPLAGVEFVVRERESRSAARRLDFGRVDPFSATVSTPHSIQ